MIEMGVPGGGKVIFVTIVNTRPNVVGPLQQTKFISKTKIKKKNIQKNALALK